MHDPTKIMLSPQELEIVSDSSWVLTKQEIIRKVYEVFTAQVPVIARVFMERQANMPASILSSRPKISRGENYLGLPYVILDYPSVFRKDNIFAFRTMFWWGNFFSVTLHLSGEYKQIFERKMSETLLNSNKDEIYLCVNDEPWEHHFEQDNYRMVGSMATEDLKLLVAEKEFIKVAVKINLNRWNELGEQLPSAFSTIIKLIAT